MLRLDRLLTLYAFTALRKFVSAKNPSIPILMYHSISDEPESGHPYFWINTSRQRFAEQMQILKESECRVISLTEAVGILETSFVTHNANDFYFIIGIQNKGAMAIDNLVIQTDPANRPITARWPEIKRTWKSPERTAFSVMRM